jgi:hypothetical protein
MSVPALSLAADRGVSSELERTAATSPEEQIAYAASAIDEISDVVASLENSKEAIKGEGGDEEAEQCIRNALMAARFLSEAAGKAEGAIGAAISEGSKERADFELRKIAVALDKARQIQAEGQLCASTSGSQDGQTTVDWEGEMEGFDDETRPVPEDVLDFGFDPPNVSPF